MQNDSLEALLSRHYGSAAPAPQNLEEQLCASVRQEAAELQAEQRIAAFLSERPVSRRKAVKWVAFGAAGVGLLDVGLAGVQALEDALVGRSTTKPQYS
jgi:hypothetical protein